MPWYPKNTVYGQTDLLKYPYYCYVLITTYQQSRWYEEVHWQFEKGELMSNMSVSSRNTIPPWIWIIDYIQMDTNILGFDLP